MSHEWKAKWIWDGSEECARNHWVCFRKEFNVSQCYDEVKLHITADSKYILYINGQKLGFGPVRCWNFEQSYDTYDIKDYLVHGKNSISVLVVHHGVSTFQYVQGRGGLLAQVDFMNNKSVVDNMVTDETWKSTVHNGYMSNTLKICCQQSWAEVFDSRNFNCTWVNTEFDDSSWSCSHVVGEYNTRPWEKLIPRDIPFLSMEKIYPQRVETCREVRPVSKSISINLRNALFPNVYSANPVEFTAYVCLNIYSDRNEKGSIIFPNSKWQSPRGNFKINGREYILNVDGGQYKIDVELDKGKNFMVMDIGGRYHEIGMLMAFDFENEIEFLPFESYGESRCLVIGPFDTGSIYDTGYKMESTVNYDNDLYVSCRSICSYVDIIKFSGHIKALKDEFVLENMPYALSTVKKILSERQVDIELQNMAAVNNSYTVINPSNSGDIELIIDFGRELTGFIGFDIDSEPGAIFDFYMFECINNGIIENTTDLDNTLRYVSKKGRQTYESPVRRGFRYMMLTIRNLKEPCKLYSVYTYLSSYPVVKVGDFKCSDYKMNNIWEISRHTTQLCMEDTFVDCPAYEQTYWVGDSRNEALINYYTFGSYDIVKRCLKLVAKSEKYTGFLMDQVPSGWQSIIPNWTFFWMSACREYYEYCKDIEFLKDIYPYLLRTVSEYEKMINDKGLFEFCGWNLLDWAPMDTPDNGVVTHQNAAFVKAVKDVAWIAAVLNDSEEIDRLNILGEKIKQGINDYLWSDERNAYVDCLRGNGEKSPVISQQTNTLIYLYDCYTDDRKDYLESCILNCPEDFVKIGSPFMSFFYLEALVKMNKVNKAYEYMNKWWGMMLEHDATTCWETFPGHAEGRLTRSHCHAWSAAPGYFMGAYVLGVRLEKPGFESVIIEPNTCGLEWARGSVPVPGGRIDVEWKLEGRRMHINVKAPDWCRINLKVDKEQYEKVIFNGSRQD